MHSYFSAVPLTFFTVYAFTDWKNVFLFEFLTSGLLFCLSEAENREILHIARILRMPPDDLPTYRAAHTEQTFGVDFVL